MLSEHLAGEPRFELIEYDLCHRLPVAGQFDAIVSGLAIHHLPDGRKRELFDESHSLLQPCGTFANLDLVRSPTEKAHDRFRGLIDRPEDDPTDRLSPLPSQLEWLADAGFNDIDCLFKWRELALIVAVRI